MTTRSETRHRAREQRMIGVLIERFCRDLHGSTSGLCPDCRELLDAALARIEHCRLWPDKPVCAKCPVPCYPPALRERVRAVMRYAGPRLVWRHPWLAFRHALDRLARGPVEHRGSGRIVP